jgi:peptide/nickel transport system substrate-binding protein
VPWAALPHARTRGPSILPPSSRRATDLENHLADEFRAGRLTRRDLLRHASRIGMAVPMLGPLLGPSRSARAAPQAGTPGATIRVACATPVGQIDPITISQTGGLLMLNQVGEFLLFDGPDLVLRPMLAVAWQPNHDASVWNFSLRPGVKFHDGSPLTARDVAATMDRLCDPRQKSNALSALRGVLSPGGTHATDDLTVRFELDAPNGNFPYYVSSDNYNAIILPAAYDGDFELNFNGTGPFRLEKYTPRVGASFVPNPTYWGRQPLPARTEFNFFNDQQPQILALLDNQVDIAAEIAVQGAQGLLRDPDINIIRLRSAAHRQLHMRTDSANFADKRIRQAVALSLDRPGIIHGLFLGHAGPGNDSPFAPLYPSTDPTVPQRMQNLAAARELLRAAGRPNGFSATLTTERLQEIPLYAVIVQSACAAIGINLTLRIEDVASYYGSAQPGSSDWLDSEMGITDYGHRGAPNVTLAAPFVSNGAWNAAHFRDPAYDRLVAAYNAAIDLQSQRAVARDIELLLLDETPVVIPYFYDFLVAAGRSVRGVRATAISQLFLQDAWLAA